MKIIIGLGNPGAKYEKTRHNIGFMVVDYLARKYKFPAFKELHQGLLTEGSLLDNRTILCKPLTYMNKSGECLVRVLKEYQATLKDCIVLQDDLDIPFGKTKIRRVGGPGGHKGIASIIDLLEERSFDRVKIGINRPEFDADMSGHVLGDFTKEECEVIEKELFTDVEAKIQNLFKETSPSE